MRFTGLFSKLVLTGCILATIPTAFAQDNERPRRGGQGGGPGGPGGGRMGMGMMGGGGMAGLLAMKEVQAELKLEESQTKQLDEFRTSMMEKMRGQFGGGNQGGGPPDFTKMRETMTKMTAETEAKLEEVLDPVQLDRLVGLALQQNPTVFSSSKLIAARISLTEAQQAKITEIETAQGEEMRFLFSGGGGPEAFEKMRKMREETVSKIQAVLTEKQKAEIETLKGEKFTFPEMPRGGFGPGGQGGGPGGRGGRGRPGNDGT